ncbi:hypothetical protein BLA28_25160 [Eisenbergiella tayi]|nr:hypothetical protein BLA28_25160 [Eisenbergiella tayi]
MFPAYYAVYHPEHGTVQDTLVARGYWIYYKAAATAIAPGLSFVRPAAHVSNRCKSGIRPVHSIQTEGYFGDIKENESYN